MATCSTDVTFESCEMPRRCETQLCPLETRKKQNHVKTAHLFHRGDVAETVESYTLRSHNTIQDAHQTEIATQRMPAQGKDYRRK